MRIKYSQVSIVKKSTDFTGGGISSNNTDLTLCWGGDDAWVAGGDLVLCDGTHGKTEVIRNKRHMMKVLKSPNGYLKAVDSRWYRNGFYGPMDGGNKADGEWMVGNILIDCVPIHDRYETLEQYETLSR
jgi:hypothetical protein